VTDGAPRVPAPKAGELLLRDAPLERVEFAPDDAALILAAGGRRVRFAGVRATNFLAPWDGTPGTVEWLRVASAGAGEICLELRVRWREVPRVYRMVCASVTVVEERGRDRA
jgi:hypothetical protein